MAELRLRQFADLDRLSHAATRDFCEYVEATVLQQARCSIVLAGGSTPRRLYELVAATPIRARINWAKVSFFWGDERCVAPNHADSNYAMANKSMLATLQIPSSNIFRMRGEATDLASAANEYAEMIAGYFEISPGDPPPAFDLVLLGLGPDGHTASLFPKTEALASDQWVVANHVPRLQAWRLTMTAPLINAARKVAFLAAGNDKAGALAAVLEGPPDFENYPAQLIKPAGELTWYIDKLAAAKLQRRLDMETSDELLPVSGFDFSK